MPPAEAEAECYVWDILETCTLEEKKVLASGKAITENFILRSEE